MLEKTPFKVHVFVCQNTRPDQPDRESCGGEVSQGLAQKLKDFVDENSLKAKVRISSSKCLGPCGKGPNVMIYPQEIWFTKCKSDDLSNIQNKIIQCLESN